MSEDKDNAIEFSFSGLSIPIDEVFMEGLKKLITDKIWELLSEDYIVKRLVQVISTSKVYFEKALTPLIRNILEDLHLTVDFSVEDD